jgi:hypothetical protein
VIFVTEFTYHYLRFADFQLDFCRWSVIGYLYQLKKEGLPMNLDEFKSHVQAQREASKAEALSVLSAKIIVKKEGN